MRRSESRRLDYQPLTAEPRFQELLRLETQTQLPRVLRVQTKIVGGNLSDYRREELANLIGGAGVWSNQEAGSEGMAPSPWHGGAALRVESGTVGAASRTIVADLRPGEYVVPPCTHATISAAWWRAVGVHDFENYPLEVTVEVADGVLTDATPFMLSASRIVTTSDPVFGGVRASVSVPSGAYAWDVGHHYTVSRIEASCGAVYAVRDRAAGISWPAAFPLPVIGPRVNVTNADLVASPLPEGEERSWVASVLFFIR